MYTTTKDALVDIAQILHREGWDHEPTEDKVEGKPKTSRPEMSESAGYVVVMEKASDGSFSAFVPDLPGCVSCGDTIEELRDNMAVAIRLHIDSLQVHGEAIPGPTSQACLITV